MFDEGAGVRFDEGAVVVAGAGSVGTGTGTGTSADTAGAAARASEVLLGRVVLRDSVRPISISVCFC